MVDILSIIGVFLAIEGAIYAGVPGFARRMAAKIAESDENALRQAGLIGLCVGVFLVWLARG